MSAVLLAALALPALAALACAVAPPATAEGPGRLGAAAAATSFALALVVAVAVVGSGPLPAVAGVFADRLSAVMLLLVFGVSAVVQLFAGRYLSGDPRQGRLIAAAGLTTTAAATVACAATLGVLLAGWLLSGAGLLLMLAQRADLPAARVGLRRTAAAFAVGDFALVAAAVLTWATVGGLDLRDVDAGAAALAGERVAGVSAGAVVACLLVVAALGRSALLPLQRWLPATLAAPTPVSAFLHAGLVNAGGFLLVRLGPVFGLTPVAPYLAFAAGAATAVYGTVLMLARPDVKGALAHSTMGQMGFMVMACALGAWAAAIFHLVAHGMYKATLFLGADSVIHNDKRRAFRPRPAATRWPTGARRAVAALVPALALTAALATFAQAALDHPGALVLLAFAWATAAHAGYAWLGTAPGQAAAGLTGLALCCLAYAGLVAAANAFLAPSLGAVDHAASPWAAVVPAAAILGALAARGRAGLRIQRAWYARALDAGHVAAHRPPLATRPVRRPVPSLPTLGSHESVTA